MLLAGILLKDIQRMPANPISGTKDTKLVFVGYGAAGWVIQEALAWYSNTSTQTARRTPMVILLNLPPIASEAALKTYLEQFPKLYPGKDKKINLEFSIIEIIQNNFTNLVKDKLFGPKERRINIPGKANTSPTNSLGVEVRPRNDSVLRRETSDTHHTSDSTGSSNTDSSAGSVAAQSAEQIPFWEIVKGDKTDEEVKSLLRTSLVMEKPPEDMISQSYTQPEYEPLDQQYGSVPAKDFLPRRTTGFSTKSTKKSNFYNRLNSPPPTPPEESDDLMNRISTEILPVQQIAIRGDSPAVENSRELLSNLTPPSSAHPDVFLDQETIHHTTDAWSTTDMDTVTEAEAEDDPIRQENSPAPETSSNDFSEATLSAERQKLRLAFLYQQSGELRQAKALYQSLMDSPAMAQGLDIIRTQIAITWLYEGRVKEAEEVFSDLEPKVEAEYARAPQRTWEVKRWLAISLDMQGFYERGRQKLININQAFTSFQQAQQVTDIGLLTRSTLALVLGHLGKYGEALTRSEKVLELASQVVERAKKVVKDTDGGKGDQADLTIQLGALGSIQFDRAKILTYVGRYQDAEDLNSQALENIQRNVGSKHVSTLECWSLKARHFASTCRLPEAEEQCQKTLKVMRTEIGKEHPSTLRALGVLVYVYRLQARLTEALDTAKYLLDKCKSSEAFGKDHPETIHSMWQLAEVYLARGDFSNALRYQDQAVKLADKVLGKVHPTVLNYRACLARVYCKRGSWKDSGELCLVVLDNYVSIISEAFQGTAKIIRKQENSKQNEPDSRSVIQQALDKARDIIFEKNDDFATLNLSLASTIQCLGVTERERQHGNLEVAQEIQTKAYDYMVEKLGQDHVDTLSAKWDLALTKLKRGEEGALRDLEAVTLARRRLLGGDHPDTLAARHHLSAAKFNQFGNLSELDEQAEVLHLCIYLLGEEHPTTNSARIDLSNGYHLVRTSGMLVEAEKLRLKALQVQIKTLPHPELSGSAKDSYEQALVAVGLNESSSVQEESCLEPSKKDDPAEPNPKHCHAQVISSLAALALIYVDLAQSADEEALLSIEAPNPESEKAHQLLVSQYNNKAIALQRAVFFQQQLLPSGEHNPEALESLNTLGLIYQAAGKTEEALASYSMVQRHAEDSTVLHFTVQSNLGTLFFGLGQFEIAEEVQTKAYEKRGKYGEGVVGDREYVIAVFNLALTKEERGKREEALELMGKALKLSRDAFGHSDSTTGRILDTWREWSATPGL
jgi:tetratricopeptide (TPR) repeat protein